MSEFPMDLSSGPPFPPGSAVDSGRMSEKQLEKVEDQVCYHQAQLVRPQQITETSTDSSVFYQQRPSSSNQHVAYFTSDHEKVEDEVRYHQAQAQLVRPQQITQPSTDSSVFYQQQPSSSNQHVAYSNNGYHYNSEMNAYVPNGYAYSNPALSFDHANTDSVYSTTTLDPRQLLDPVPDNSSLLSTNMPSGAPPSYSTCHIDLLATALSNAYKMTYLYTTDAINEMMRRPQDDKIVSFYRNMDHDQLWLDCAGGLTRIIQQIIEFTKMIPGFIKLPQDDQILLLKSGGFELSIIRMSRYYDLSTGCVLHGEFLLPEEAFTTSDETEMQLVHNAFAFARFIAEAKLNDTELALYSTFVLLSQDLPGLKGLAEIQKLSQATLKALRQGLEHTHNKPHRPSEGEVPAFDALLGSIPALRGVSLLYMEALANLRRTAPNLEFPALHKELFQ